MALTGGRVAVAVVGGGIIGCSIAREVADRTPYVALLDRDLVGGGATLRSAGLHLPRGGTERVRRMTALSHDRYERLLAADPTLPIHPLRLAVVAPEAGEAALLAGYLDRARLVRADAVPGAAVRVPAGSGVWLGEGCHHADVRGVAQGIARALRRRIDVREGVRVVGLDADAGPVRLALSTGDALAAERVVLAPGPWIGAPAWAPLLAPLGLRIKKIVALHIDRAPAPDDRVVVFDDEDAFLLPLADRGHWLFSYTCSEWDVDPDSVLTGVVRRDLDEACECLLRYAPALVDRRAGGRVFCDAYSPVREPCVRALDDEGRVVFAGAAGGSGYRLAPAIAAEAAGLLR